MGKPLSRLLWFVILVACLLSGCGLELIQTMAHLSSGNPVNMLPSWPVDMKVGLGAADLPVSSFVSSSSTLPLAIDPDKTYVLTPDGKAIDPVKLGDKLVVPAQATRSIFSQTITVPNPNQSITGPTLTLDSLGITSLAFGASTLGWAIDNAPDPTGMPSTVAFNQPQNQTVSLGSLRRAKLGAGSTLTLKITNTVGGAHQAELGLTLGSLLVESNGIDLDQVWRGANPSVSLATDSITVTLDPGRIISGALTITFSTSGQIPAGYNIKNLQRSQAVVINSITTNFNLAAISLPSQSLSSTTQSIDLPVTTLASQGISNLSNIKIATGSIVLHLTNGLTLNSQLTLELDGILNTSGAIYTKTFTIGASSSTDLVVPLAGTTLTGTASGSTHVDVKLTGQTLDTETVAPAIDPSLVLPQGMATYQATQSLAASFELPELDLDSLMAELNRTVAIPTASTSVSLPQQLQALKVGFARISIQLQVNNQSQLPSDLALDAKAVLNDGSVRPLTYTGGHAIQPATAIGDTVVSTIAINETNSNIVDLLNAGIKELDFGGTVTLSTGATPVVISRLDQLSAKVGISVPLSLIFPEIGVGKTVPPYDIKPASPLNLDDSTKAKLSQGLVSQVALTAAIDNGLHIPLGLDLLISKQGDPYADAAPMVKALALGDGSATQVSLIQLNSDEIASLKDAKTLGFRISSPGTNGKPVSLHSTDALHIRLLAELKLRVSAKTFQGGSSQGTLK